MPSFDSGERRLEKNDFQLGGRSRGVKRFSCECVGFGVLRIFPGIVRRLVSCLLIRRGVVADSGGEIDFQVDFPREL